ncbi:MAG: hypothetical protein P8Y20_03540 [Gammaproteobacteria bacterium]|jgi:ABC-type amino acid transport substrate-binding protein
MIKPIKTLVLFLSSFLFLTSTAQANKLDEILETGKIRVGVSLFTPWSMKTETGLKGFEIDVANKLAQDTIPTREYPMILTIVDRQRF